MMTFIVISVVGAFLVTSVVFALSLAREKGALTERLKKLEEQSAIDKKQAEIVAGARTDDETIDRLNSGSF